MILIAIDSSQGLIGVGKSTLTKMLNERLTGSKAFYETVESEFLEPMYKELAENIVPSPAAFYFQVRALGNRHLICQDAWNLRFTRA